MACKRCGVGFGWEPVGGFMEQSLNCPAQRFEGFNDLASDIRMVIGNFQGQTSDRARPPYVSTAPDSSTSLPAFPSERYSPAPRKRVLSEAQH
jgi:hypothetical protein